MGLLEAPGALGADIVTGEMQSFGLPLSFGGPYLGFMACRKEYVRQLPGRIAGQTTDVEGRRGFVLTLATREQHIRREKATSNICTNQALCALRATIFLESLGRPGLREMAWQNAQKAAYALDVLTAVPGVRRRFGGPPFNEFVLEFPRPWAEVDARPARPGHPRRPRARGDLPRARELGPGLRHGAQAQGRHRPARPGAPGGPEMINEIREPLIFELSAPGKKASLLAPLDVPEKKGLLEGVALRRDIDGFPEVSEPEVVRHFTRLSQKNYCVDLGLYPLGSCTMKYNPKVNDRLSALPGLAGTHPEAPEDLVQGNLSILKRLEGFLSEIAGMVDGCEKIAKATGTIA